MLAAYQKLAQGKMLAALRTTHAIEEESTENTLFKPNQGLQSKEKTGSDDIKKLMDFKHILQQ